VGICRWAVALTLVAATACGQPEHRYITNKAEGIYIKVPRHWNQIDQAEFDAEEIGDPFSLDGQIKRALTWGVAFDAADPPTLAHLPAGSDSAEPLVFLKVVNLAQWDLPPLESAEALKNMKALRANMSLDILRNSFLPTTEDRRATIGASGELGAKLVKSFELLRDEEVTPGKGLYGVRSVYNYKIGTQLETFDVTALVDDKHSRFYLLVVRCTAMCYVQRHAELNDVVNSFTVRGSG
jgi:hypothetical protein